MKYFKYIIVISIIIIGIIIPNAKINNDVLATNTTSVLYNNKEVNNNKVNLENTTLTEDEKTNKQTITYTNTTNNEILLTKDNLTITSNCDQIKIDTYFNKDSKNYDKLVLKPGESALINVVLSTNNITETEICNYSIALNIGANI